MLQFVAPALNSSEATIGERLTSLGQRSGSRPRKRPPKVLQLT